MAETQNTRTGGGTKYYQISNGSVERYVGDQIPEGENPEDYRKHTTGAKSRTPNRVIYYKKDLVVSGEIVNIKKRETPHGDTELNLTMKDADGWYVVSANLFNSYSENLLNRLCGIVGGENMFHVSACAIQATDRNTGAALKKDDGSPIMNMFVILRQGTNDKANGIKSFYRHEDLPPIEKVNVKGKINSDNTNRIEFLYKAALANLHKLFGLVEGGDRPQADPAPQTSSSSAQPSAFNPAGADGDLPF